MISTKSVEIFSIFILALLDNSLGTKQEPKPKSIICYYDSTSYWGSGLGRFQAKDIDPFICTHIQYSFLGIKESTSRLYSRDPGLDLGPQEIEPEPDDEFNNVGDVDNIRNTVKLRDEANPDLKIIISIGGPAQSLQSMTEMAKDAGRRQRFVESTMEYIQRFDLDGVDLYWAYPSAQDKLNFVQVLKELKEAMTFLSNNVTGKEYILTSAFGCTKSVIDEGYEVGKLAEYLDYFNLLCFDFRMYSEESETNRRIGHHSNLYSEDELNVAFGVDYFLQLGAHPEKLLLGIACHARTYTLQTAQENNLNDIAKGPGTKGPFTEINGFLAYFEICYMIQQNITGWLFRYDYDYRIPYVSNNEMFIGYENEISVQEKVDFAVAKNLGGLMAKFIDLDDSKNTCGAWYPSFPIISSIKTRLEFWAGSLIKLEASK